MSAGPAPISLLGPRPNPGLAGAAGRQQAHRRWRAGRLREEDYIDLLKWLEWARCRLPEGHADAAQAVLLDSASATHGTIADAMRRVFERQAPRALMRIDVSHFLVPSDRGSAAAVIQNPLLYGTAHSGTVRSPATGAERGGIDAPAAAQQQPSSAACPCLFVRGGSGEKSVLLKNGDRVILKVVHRKTSRATLAPDVATLRHYAGFARHRPAGCDRADCDPAFGTDELWKQLQHPKHEAVLIYDVPGSAGGAGGAGSSSSPSSIVPSNRLIGYALVMLIDHQGEYKTYLRACGRGKLKSQKLQASKGNRKGERRQYWVDDPENGGARLGLRQHVLLLAIDPLFSGRGIGSAALRFVFECGDKMGLDTMLYSPPFAKNGAIIDGRNFHLSNKVGFYILKMGMRADLIADFLLGTPNKDETRPNEPSVHWLSEGFCVHDADANLWAPQLAQRMNQDLIVRFRDWDDFYLEAPKLNPRNFMHMHIAKVLKAALVSSSSSASSSSTSSSSSRAAGAPRDRHSQGAHAASAGRAVDVDALYHEYVLLAFEGRPDTGVDAAAASTSSASTSSASAAASGASHSQSAQLLGGDSSPPSLRPACTLVHSLTPGNESASAPVLAQAGASGSGCARSGTSGTVAPASRKRAHPEEIQPAYPPHDDGSDDDDDDDDDGAAAEDGAAARSFRDATHKVLHCFISLHEDEQRRVLLDFLDHNHTIADLLVGMRMSRAAHPSSSSAGASVPSADDRTLTARSRLGRMNVISFTKLLCRFLPQSDEVALSALLARIHGEPMPTPRVSQHRSSAGTGSTAEEDWNVSSGGGGAADAGAPSSNTPVTASRAAASSCMSEPAWPSNTGRNKKARRGFGAADIAGGGGAGASASASSSSSLSSLPSPCSSNSGSSDLGTSLSSTRIVDAAPASPQLSAASDPSRPVESSRSAPNSGGAIARPTSAIISIDCEYDDDDLASGSSDAGSATDADGVASAAAVGRAAVVSVIDIDDDVMTVVDDNYYHGSGNNSSSRNSFDDGLTDDENGGSAGGSSIGDSIDGYADGDVRSHVGSPPIGASGHIRGSQAHSPLQLQEINEHSSSAGESTDSVTSVHATSTETAGAVAASSGAPAYLHSRARGMAGYQWEPGMSQYAAVYRVRGVQRWKVRCPDLDPTEWTVEGVDVIGAEKFFESLMRRHGLNPEHYRRDYPGGNLQAALLEDPQRQAALAIAAAESAIAAADFADHDSDTSCSSDEGDD